MGEQARPGHVHVVRERPVRYHAHRQPKPKHVHVVPERPVVYHVHRRPPARHVHVDRPRQPAYVPPRHVNRYDPCQPILERIRTNRHEIRRWEYSGRHENAVRWYKEDLIRADQDLRACRMNARWDRRRYDRDHYRGNPYLTGGYDPYYERDSGFGWGTLLGGLLGGY